MSNLRAIPVAGTAVGVLDGFAAVISAGIRGVTPDRVFQYISSGLLGKSAFEGGAATIALGVFLHFVVAFGAAAVYILAAGKLSFPDRFPWITGPLYGILVYFLMSEAVSALSNVSRGSRTLSGTITGILIHIFFVGLPIALVSARSRGSSG